MRSKLEMALWWLTPPVALVAARRLHRLLITSVGPEGRTGARAQMGCERDSAWYDVNFPQSMRQHYSLSRYYPFWAVIADRILRHGVSSILEIGCGAGQLAALLHDKGLRTYCGIDFSSKRIEHARLVCPDFMFIVADAFGTDVFDIFRYDTVVCTEFLEHVERDVEVLGRIRQGAVFYGSVPSFPSASHVRHFSTADQVNNRYAALFREFRVDPFRAGADTFFLLEGVKE